ncbi:MAG: Rieske 2Fe-2S domain-containing protein [Deltaproteobacteria bacterium]|nr:MAG: Rieske 2Fe-2S domain-containing protein [Deltaproteobacteria bacterium]
MRPETRSELAQRLFHYLDTGTTAMAGAMFQNPVAAYTSDERLALEKRILFRDYPLLVAFSSQLARAGDYLTDDDSGTPILVVRTGSGRLNAFANVCRHRGARVVEGCGAGKWALGCPYHGWTYDLDGALIDVPGEAGFADLPREQHGLRRLAVVERYGLVWVRPDPTAAATAIDIDVQLGGLAAELESFGFERYHHFETRTLRPRINWKVAVDTFLEAYHLPALHARSVGPIFVGNLCAADAFGHHHRMIAVRRSFAEVRDRREAERDFLRHTIELYTLFPNTVFIHQADHVEVWRMFPGDTPDSATVRLSLYVPEAPATEKARQHWAANMQLAIDAVDVEDFRLGEGIQRGFRSGAQDHVTYGRNEPALIHFHRSLGRALGLDGAR